LRQRRKRRDKPCGQQNGELPFHDRPIALKLFSD